MNPPDVLRADAQKILVITIVPGTIAILPYAVLLVSNIPSVEIFFNAAIWQFSFLFLVSVMFAGLILENVGGLIEVRLIDRYLSLALPEKSPRPEIASARAIGEFFWWVVRNAGRVALLGVDWIFGVERMRLTKFNADWEGYLGSEEARVLVVQHYIARALARLRAELACFVATIVATFGWSMLMAQGEFAHYSRDVQVGGVIVASYLFFESVQSAHLLAVNRSRAIAGLAARKPVARGGAS